MFYVLVNKVLVNKGKKKIKVIHKNPNALLFSNVNFVSRYFKAVSFFLFAVLSKKVDKIVPEICLENSLQVLLSI